MPGMPKRRAIREKDGRVRLPWTCVFLYVDREGIERVGKGRTFTIGEQDIDLFPVGVLCGMLGRHRRAIYKWEKNFGFPPALFRVSDDKKCNRWYSRKQLVAIRTIYEHMGNLRGKDRVKLRPFITAVKKVFYDVDAPLVKREEGQINASM